MAVFEYTKKWKLIFFMEKWECGGIIYEYTYMQIAIVAQ